jgi:hypothetical protein
MLPNNFNTLASQIPEYRAAILRIGEWARNHSDWPFLDPRTLSRDLRDIDPVRLALTLHELVQVGSYRQVYKVLAPDGTFVEDEYASPLDVPPHPRDGFNHPFRIEDGDIVPVFTPVR